MKKSLILTSLFSALAMMLLASCATEEAATTTTTTTRETAITQPVTGATRLQPLRIARVVIKPGAKAKIEGNTVGWCSFLLVLFNRTALASQQDESLAYAVSTGASAICASSSA